MRKLLGLGHKKEKSIGSSSTPSRTDPQDIASSSISRWLPIPTGYSHATANQPQVDPGTRSSKSVAGMSAPIHVTNEGNYYHASGSAKIDIHTGHRIQYGDIYNIQPDKSTPDTAIMRIPHSNYAEYDVIQSVTRGPCTPGTRTDVLGTLDKWSKSGRSGLYWLNGVAGCGKTTISYSYCSRMRDKKRLGASFFCSRSLEECRDTKLIIPTIAYQLSQKYPRYKEALADVLKTDPNIFKKSLESQLCGLIIEPWLTKKWRLPSDIVVVIDALDECDGGHSAFLNTLFNHTTKLPFKILLTSRPDYSIRDTMRGKDPSVLSTFVLHEVEGGLVQEDITKYLRHQLSGHVPKDVIDALTQLSGSLFIIAATLSRLFTGGNIDARARLELLRTSLPIQKSVLDSLDEFYHGVLSSALHEGELLGAEIESIKDVLFTVVCARDPLSLEGLAVIVGISEEETLRRLDSLRSILYIPGHRDYPIVVLHASLPDFIQDFSRSGVFHCYPSSFHLKTLRRCLVVLDEQLSQDKYGLARPRVSLSTKPGMVRSQISHPLRYAALYWVEHLVLSDKSLRQMIFDMIFDFLSLHALDWIELLSHLSRLPRVIESLESLLQIVDEGAALAKVTYEYLRMIQYHYEGIRDNSEDIYRAITIIPLHSPLRNHAELISRCPKVTVLCGMPTDWPALERVIDIHSKTVNSIAISQKGDRMASGSGDGTVRIWNIGRHTEECALTDHTDQVNCVAFTRDGSHVVSGSHDRTVRVWEAATNKVVRNLDASGPVYAVALSSDETYLASGDKIGRIQVWDAVNGQLLRTLDGHTDTIRSLLFIPDTPDFVSGSMDHTARVWNALTGETKSTLYGHTSWVYSVACSPFGDRIVTGSADGSSRIWNIPGQELQVLRGHSDWVSAVAFMPNGKQVVTGSYDRTLRVWDVVTGHPLHVFRTDSVRSVAIFPGGLKIASSSGSRINIWSMRSVNSQVTANETARVTAIKADRIVLSSDGQRALLLPSLQILDTSTLDGRVVLHSQNRGHDCGAWSATRRRVAIATYNENMVEVWELNGDDVGNPLTLTGHTDNISHISFSHDERLLCSASFDKTVGVWALTTGEQVHALQHPANVYCASFSHNDTQLVSNCRKTIHIWATQTGEQLYKIDTTNTYSCTFTPDDQHIITRDTQTPATIAIWNARTGEKENEHKGYVHWITLNDGTSYALSIDGWICQFARFGDTPRQLLWIPPPHRPNIWVPNNPLFSLFSQGVQLCLPRKDGLISLIIPQEFSG